MGSPLLSRLLGLGALSWLAACGAPPPPPVVPAEIKPSRPPTLSVAFDYVPELVILIRLDGQPVEGPVDVIGRVPIDKPIPGYTDPSLPVIDQTVHAVARGGKVKLEQQDTTDLRAKEDHRLRVGDLVLPLPRLGANDPFACAADLIEASMTEICTSAPLPSAPPASCDSRGVEVWRSIHARQDETFEGCWGKLDRAAIARLETVTQGGAKQHICRSLTPAQIEALDDDLGGRLYPHCEGWLPVASRVRLRTAWRRLTLPAALAEIEGSTPRKMQEFYRDYSITGDPRVEQVRLLAAKKFGPPDLALFEALQQTLARTPSSQGHHATLCELDTSEAIFTILMPPARPDLRSGRKPVYRGTDYSPPPMLPVPPPPAAYLSQISGILKTRARVKSARRTDACNPDRYWFLATPLPAPG